MRVSATRMGRTLLGTIFLKPQGILVRTFGTYLGAPRAAPKST